MAYIDIAVNPHWCRDDMDRDAALEKIKKCLALSASPNENEARTALLMARRLMAEYKIGSPEEELSGGQVPEQRETSITFTTIRDNWVLDLLNLVGPRYCCRPYSSKVYRKKTRTAGFAGFPQDLDVCIPAFELAANTIRSNIISARMDKAEGDSYARGFIQGLASEYARQDAEMMSDTITERSLVTVMEVPEEVDRYVSSNFRTSRVSLRAYGRDEGAFNSGFSDGKNHLSRKVRGDPVKQLKG